MKEQEDIISLLQDIKTKEIGFRQLVSEYKERLYWHIRKIVVNHDDTDDVLQNTFIKVFKNIDGFKGDSKLYSWMYRIATNEAITFINKRSKQHQISTEEMQMVMVNNLKADTYFDGDEAQLKLQQAIATLPQKQQLVFNMKYFDNMKYDEISDVLETSVGALKSSYHIAVKKIEHFIKTN